MNTPFYTCAIASVTAAGVVIRPFRLPEAIWAVGGALLVLASFILNPMEVWAGVAKGEAFFQLAVKLDQGTGGCRRDLVPARCRSDRAFRPFCNPRAGRVNDGAPH